MMELFEPTYGKPVGITRKREALQAESREGEVWIDKRITGYQIEKPARARREAWL